MSKLIFIGCLIALSICSCKKKIVENRLIGEWKCEYELHEDGTKHYGDQYALLGWNYSDGIILYKDGTCQSMWYGKTNSERVEWSNSKNTLTIEVPKSNDEVESYEYKITEVKKNSMFLEDVTKSNKYYLKKQ